MFMRLFFANGACSLSPHIVLRETGLPAEFTKVDLTTKKTESGADFTKINDRSQVPALEIKEGQVLTECSAIVQYIADQKPESGMMPKVGTFDRYRAQEWLGFISTEIHKTFSPFFGANVSEDAKKTATRNISKRFDYVARKLTGRDYLLGDKFTVADAYLFTMLSWMGHAHVDLMRWPVLQAYYTRVAARPAVQQALKFEGLQTMKMAA